MRPFVENTTHGNTVLSPDFKEFIELLNKHNVLYIVIGGYALAIHGHPRYTKDIDIWIDVNAENAQKMITVIQEFGFSSVGLKESDFLESGNVIQLGLPPNRIDILTSADGVDFTECFENILNIEIDNIYINFIDINNLIKNKKNTGRLQDLADVEKLELSQQNKDDT